jgi:hypothetical protein
VLYAHAVHAQEFQSGTFRALDPVVFPANYSTSSNFQLHSTISQVAIATSTATTYKVSSGFLYFPFVSKPVGSTVAGDTQVTLNWTAANALLGWTVSGYDVGQSTVSGGPYSYSSIGNVTSSVRSGLTNGTTYYFVIVVKDAFGNRIATSTQVSGVPVGSATPPPGPPPPPPPGGGGGPPFPIDPNGGRPPVIEIPPLTEPPTTPACRKVIADINCDGKVNLVDFSIMYFWYEKRPVPVRVDLNRDGTVNIFDFSIMAYYWSE